MYVRGVVKEEARIRVDTNLTERRMRRREKRKGEQKRRVGKAV